MPTKVDNFLHKQRPLLAESGMSDHRFSNILSGRFRAKLPFRF
jgi:hypothetical protein